MCLSWSSADSRRSRIGRVGRCSDDGGRCCERSASERPRRPRICRPTSRGDARIPENGKRGASASRKATWHVHLQFVLATPLDHAAHVANRLRIPGEARGGRPMPEICVGNVDITCAVERTALPVGEPSGPKQTATRGYFVTSLGSRPRRCPGVAARLGCSSAACAKQHSPGVATITVSRRCVAPFPRGSSLSVSRAPM